MERQTISRLNLIIILSLVIIYTQVTTGLDAGEHISSLYRKNLYSLFERINEHVEPCTDFFRHVCDKRPKASEIESAEYAMESREEEIQPPPFLYNLEDRMHFYENHRSSFDTQPGKMLNNLYDDCKQRKQKNQIHWQQMLQQIEFLNIDIDIYQNWPFLHHQWRTLNHKYELNWVTLAAKFAAHGINSFLNIFFVEKTFYIAPIDDLKCPSFNEIRADLIANFLQQRNPQIGGIIANELWTFCRELTGELPLANDIYVVIPNTDVLIDDTTIGYFQTFFSILNFTETQINEARKIPINKERLAEIITLIRTTETRILYNFVVWHAYEQLKYNDCYKLTEEFERILHAEYWHWHVFGSHASRDLMLAKYIFYTTRFQKQRKDVLLLSDDWDKFLEVQLTRRDFNIKRLLQKFANSYLNVTALSSIYVDEQTQTAGAFYANLLHLRRLHLSNSFFTAFIDDEDVNQPAYFLHNFLHFTILILNQPPFHYFATQGLDLWQQSNLLYTTDGLYTALDCLERQNQLNAEEYDDNDTKQQSLFTNLTLREIEHIYRFYHAFIETYFDYKFWLDGESFAFTENFMLEYFHMNSESILFYAVTQLYCERDDGIYRTLINRSFMNMPEFQRAFNCSADAPMNPTAKCMINNYK